MRREFLDFPEKFCPGKSFMLDRRKRSCSTIQVVLPPIRRAGRACSSHPKCCKCSSLLTSFQQSSHDSIIKINTILSYVDDVNGPSPYESTCTVLHVLPALLWQWWRSRGRRRKIDRWCRNDGVDQQRWFSSSIFINVTKLSVCWCVTCALLLLLLLLLLLMMMIFRASERERFHGSQLLQ